MQTPGPRGRWGPGGSDADVYLMSWARIWFTLGNQTVYRRPHLPLPPLPFHFPVMFCRSPSGLCGQVRDITPVATCGEGPRWGHVGSWLTTGMWAARVGVRVRVQVQVHATVEPWRGWEACWKQTHRVNGQDPNGGQGPSSCPAVLARQWALGAQTFY